MALAVVAPPDGPVLNVPDVKEYLRVTHSDEDGVIAGLIDTVTAWVAGPSGWLGRSLLPQTLELTVDCPGWSRLDSWWSGLEPIVLPRPPLIAVDAVSWIDTLGVETAVPRDAYFVRQGRDGLHRLFPRTTFVWLYDTARPEVLKIRYRAGSDEVDPGIRQAMLMTVYRLYEQRGSDVTVNLQADSYIKSMFAPYRVFQPESSHSPQHAFGCG